VRDTEESVLDSHVTRNCRLLQAFELEQDYGYLMEVRRKVYSTFPVAGMNSEDTEESVLTAMIPETADFTSLRSSNRATWVSDSPEEKSGAFPVAGMNSEETEESVLTAMF
jgi:hypothetical protein